MAFDRFGRFLRKGSKAYKDFQNKRAEAQIDNAERQKRVFDAKLQAQKKRTAYNKLRKSGGSSMDLIFGSVSDNNSRMNILNDTSISKKKKSNSMDEFLKI